MRNRCVLTSLFTWLIWSLPLCASDSHMLLTIYNQNFGIVRDQRKVHVTKNPDTIIFDNVAGQIEPTSAYFQSLTDPHATVLEQSYAYDLISTDKLLQKYMHQPLNISLKDGSHYNGNLLHFDTYQLVLQEGDKGNLSMIPRENNVKEIHFNAHPQGFFSRPSLIWNIAPTILGDQWVETTYQTAGLNWQANYNALLDSEEEKMHLQGSVTLSNESGATYKDAELKLIAGEPKKAMPQPMGLFATNNAFSKRQVPSAFHEEAFFEYHLYTLNRPITLVNNQTKYIPLFEALDVPVKKQFVYEGAPQHVVWRTEPITDANFGISEEGNEKIQVFIEFKNSLDAHLGMPLPEGVVRLYKKDPADQVLEFIGEDMMHHTPKDKKVRLNIGNAFDLVGHRKRIDFQVDLGRRMMTETFEIELQNAHNTPVEVLVKEFLYRWNTWEILSSTIPYEKKSAHTIQFHVPVEKNSEQIFTYTVRYNW